MPLTCTRIPSDLQLSEGYSKKLYRWEHNYFLENFVQAVCRLELAPSYIKDLEQELDGLIARLQKNRAMLITRDFQSQNILLKHGRPFLWLIFRVCGKGCLFYDLGSLICDLMYFWLTENGMICWTVYYDWRGWITAVMEYIKYFWGGFSANGLCRHWEHTAFWDWKKQTGFSWAYYNGLANLLKACHHTRELPDSKI